MHVRGWGGDVVGVLIDPMAHGAHAETDLAALGVFGQPHLERVHAGYHEVSALADGWQERVALHQLHMLMIHVYLFGGGYYGAQAAALARRYAWEGSAPSALGRPGPATPPAGRATPVQDNPATCWTAYARWTTLWHQKLVHRAAHYPPVSARPAGSGRGR